MSQGQLAIDWSKDVSLPISGSTPLSRHCSSTGAQAASVTHGSKLSRLLDEFSKARRLTLAETAALLGVQCHALCSTWNRAKVVLNWIEETGDVKRVRVGTRVVTKKNRKAGEKIGDETPIFTEQAYHRITKAGKQAAFDHLKRSIEEIEAGQ